MRLLVCGGRDYDDKVTVFAALDRAHAKRGITCVIHGGARGADALADAWAKFRGIEAARYPAQWAIHGNAAGPIRNRQMLTEGKPDGVVAFPGGRGTADMIQAAEAAGLRVWRPVK